MHYNIWPACLLLLIGLPLAVHRDGFPCLCQLPNDLETSLKFRTGLHFLRGPYSELFDFNANNDSLICLFRFTLKVPLRNTLIFLCFLSHLFSKEFKDWKEGVHLIHFLSSSTAPSPVREVYTTANHHRASDGAKVTCSENHLADQHRSVLPMSMSES